MKRPYKITQNRRVRFSPHIRDIALVLVISAVIVVGISYASGQIRDTEEDTVHAMTVDSILPKESSADEAVNTSEVVPESDAEQDSPPDEIVNEDAYADHQFYEADMPILVNRDNYIPEGYLPDLLEIGNGYYLNRKAAGAWLEMCAAAESDGISIWPVSAYRSNERQQQNFDNSIESHVAAGRTSDEAYAMTAAYIAIPGTSEHTLGLAVDVNSLYESFEDTAEFVWLKENCAEFGFILRYPKDKTDITNISYEPWHYRYVGVNHATTIMENDLCLEEYLAD